ncbi:hypothetical protein AcV7_002831 [Taiwanofungus camphoratus]|nr:hypothetical protein AcV7_002831 [Antrodia cinnamomea]
MLLRNASIYLDSEYVVPVTIGTPGITLYLDFDTGSSDLWVWSMELANISKYRQAHHIYNPHNSSTAHRSNGTWEISYGDGSSASGDVFTDNVTVAGITIPNQAVEVARHLSSAFLQDGGNDGLLGLAWPSLNTVQPHTVATPVENMINKGLITVPVFTVKLGHGRHEPSFYSFGFIDENVTKHRIHYTTVDSSQGFWQVSSRGWMLNGHQHSRHGNTAILDTGTSLCLVHDDVVEAIYGAIHGASYHYKHGGWVYPAGAHVPDVAFAVGNHLYNIHPKDFAFGDADNGYKLGGIQSRGDLDYDIFGDVFLKSVYVVFDQRDHKVGVAQRDD